MACFMLPASTTDDTRKEWPRNTVLQAPARSTAHALSALSYAGLQENGACQENGGMPASPGHARGTSQGMPGGRGAAHLWPGPSCGRCRPHHQRALCGHPDSSGGRVLGHCRGYLRRSTSYPGMVPLGRSAQQPWIAVLRPPCTRRVFARLPCAPQTCECIPHCRMSILAPATMVVLTGQARIGSLNTQD